MALIQMPLAQMASVQVSKTAHGLVSQDAHAPLAVGLVPDDAVVRTPCHDEARPARSAGLESLADKEPASVHCCDLGQCDCASVSAILLLSAVPLEKALPAGHQPHRLPLYLSPRLTLPHKPPIA
ncbi:MAG: hypothetical protein Q8J78_16425 [Moraxellaceae bacterium]|nr:hypothetical protein [Moraxellaceae bacterium]